MNNVGKLGRKTSSVAACPSYAIYVGQPTKDVSSWISGARPSSISIVCAPGNMYSVVRSRSVRFLRFHIPQGARRKATYTGAKQQPGSAARVPQVNVSSTGCASDTTRWERVGAFYTTFLFLGAHSSLIQPCNLPKTVTSMHEFPSRCSCKANMYQLREY